jgi:hypothetical protein
MASPTLAYDMQLGEDLASVSASLRLYLQSALMLNIPECPVLLLCLIDSPFIAGHSCLK